MVKTQTDGEGDQHADNFCPRVKAMYPGIFIEIKEDVHFNPWRFPISELRDCGLNHSSIPEYLNFVTF
jgi:hypothetical protein